MANYYTDGSTLLRSECVPHMDKVLKAWNVLSERPDHKEAFHCRDFAPYNLEVKRDEPTGGLLISSNEGSFDDDTFFHFFGLMLKNGWITGDFIDISLACWADRIVPGEYGGYNLRVTAEGEHLATGTWLSSQLTNEQYRAVHAIMQKSPDEILDTIFKDD